MTVGWDTPLSINANVFKNVNYNNVTLYVPKGTKAAYQAAAVWQDFGAIVEQGDGGMQVGDTFTGLTAEGVTMTFKVTSLSPMECQAGPETGPAVSEEVTGSVTIPSTVNGFSVISIGNGAFSGLVGVTAVTIPNSVKTIGDQAFAYSGLTAIEIPNSVTSIGETAFDYCRSLSYVTIGNSVKTIGKWAFDGCRGLTTVTIPASVTSIGEKAFQACEGLTEVVSLSETPFAISDDVFNTSMRTPIYTSGTLRVPYGTKAAYQATAGWSNFQNIVEGTLKVGDIFTEKTKEGVTMTFVVTSIDPMECQVGDGTQASISTGTHDEVTIPEKPHGYVTRKIADYGFAQCSQMIHCWVNDSIWYIGAHAFDGCTKLNTVDLPRNIKEVSPYVTDKPVTFGVPADAPEGVRKSVSEACQQTGSTYTISRYQPTSQPKDERVYIWPQVRGIEDHFIAYCESVSTIVVDAANPIFDSREDCNAIIRTADNTLLFGCKNTTVPATVTAIAPYAFEGHRHLKSITLPEGLQSIGDSAFVDCTELVSVESFIARPFAIADSTFSGATYRTATLTVPFGTEELYRQADGWKNFFLIKEGIPQFIDIATATVTVADRCAYTGNPVIPDVTVVLNGQVLTEGTDYILTLSENIRTGVASLTITGAGNYTGSVTKTFVIYVNPAFEVFINDVLVTPVVDELLNESAPAVFETEQGVISIDNYYAVIGDIVLLSVTPKPSYQISKENISGAELIGHDPDDKKDRRLYRILMPESGKVTLKATFIYQPTVDDLLPDEGDNIGGSDYSSGESGVNESTDLNEKVVGNVYYCITPDAGGYDAEEGCLVINKAATTVSTELPAVDGQLPSASNGFRGLVFFVNAGRGKVKIKAETTGNLLLCVKIAGELVMSMAVEGKTTLTIPYDVSQPSEVLVYAGFAAGSRGTAPSTTEDALKIYSLEWESEPTAIGVDKIENGKLKIENYYDLNGRKVNGQLKKGVYIVGGRKRVVK